MYTNQQQQYCNWDARSLTDTIIIIVIIAIILIILARVLYRLLTYKIIKHYNKRPLICLHILIVVWAIVKISQKLYGVIVYFTVLHDMENANIVQFSIEYTKFGMMPGFILHTIFLQVFYLYYNGLLNSIEFSELKPFERNLNKFFRINYVIRIIVKIIFLILLFTLGQLPTIVLISSLSVITLNIDGLIIFAFLFISYRILAKLFQKMPFQNQQDKLKLKWQYKFIVLICLLRQIIITLFLNSVRQALLGDQNKVCLNKIEDHVWNTIIYVVLNSLFYHIVPVLWILKIYDLEGSTLLKAKSNISERNSHLITQALLSIDRQYNQENQ